LIIGVGRDGQVLLFGDVVNEHDKKQRAKDADFIDFCENAPIALHWLSSDGTVLWANQKELDVLGYTAEEYIGQPIMKFCPDDQELFWEIFKTLGVTTHSRCARTLHRRSELPAFHTNAPGLRQWATLRSIRDIPAARVGGPSGLEGIIRSELPEQFMGRST
jgi:PAS domain-containing protein